MIWTLEAVRSQANEVEKKWDGDLENAEDMLAAARLLHFLDKVEEELEKIKDK